LQERGKGGGRAMERRIIRKNERGY
jgi:hypothetical protein